MIAALIGNENELEILVKESHELKLILGKIVSKSKKQE